MTEPGEREAFSCERVVADSLRFKRRLRIGEDAYALRRLTKEGTRLWESVGAGTAGAGFAGSAAVASTFFAPAVPTGLLAWLGLAAPAVAITPVGWVIAAGLLAGGGYFGVTRWWASQPDTAVDVIPRFISTPLDQLGAALFDLAVGLALLVARADGEVSPAERELLREHLIQDWGFDPSFVHEAMPLLEKDFDADAVTKCAREMARFLAGNPDCNTAVMQTEMLDFLRELIAVDGRISTPEQEALGRIKAVFADEGRWSLIAVAQGAKDAVATVTAAADEATVVARETLSAAGAVANKTVGAAQVLLATGGARLAGAADSAHSAMRKLLPRSQ